MIFLMSVPEAKRKRSQNFGNAEISYLIDLVGQYKEIIENKKSDAIAWRDKDRAWKEIAESLSLVFGERDTKSVKTKYEAIKKNLRKKWSVHKQNLFQTGVFTPELQLESWEEKLKDIILLSVEGEDIIYDCDTIIEETGESIKIDECLSYSKNQDRSGENCDVVDGETDCSGDYWVSNGQPRKKNKSDPGDSHLSSTDKNESCVTTDIADDVWNPRFIRSKSPSIRSDSERKSKGGNKQLHTYQELATKRIELVELQKGLLLKEYEDKKKREDEEHALKMKILEAELFIKETQIMKLNQ